NVKRLGDLHALRDQRRNYRGATGNASLAAAEADKSGKLVIEAKNIAKAYGDRTIVEGFSVRVQRGDRIGIVGPNGAGKTTLIEMLTGGNPPDSGTIRFGANIEMATLDQHRESLDPKSTLAEALTGGRGDHVMVGGRPKHVVSYMKDFLFAQEQMRTPLEVLSGGEHLARDAPNIATVEEKKEPKAAAPSAAPKRRLNFNEKHALETLPKTMAKLQSEIAKQQKLLDDPDLYTKDRKKFDAASAAMA